MGLFDLQFCAILENVTGLHLPPTDDYHFRIRCTHCTEEHPNPVYFSLAEVKDLEESKSKANYYAKCPVCKKEQTILFLEKSFRPYETSEAWQTVAKFECRGAELVGFLPSNLFVAK